VIERIESELGDSFDGYPNRGDSWWWLMPGYFLPGLFLVFWVVTLIYAVGITD